MIRVLYQDADIVVCVKPAGMVSQDSGDQGLPAMLKAQLNAKYIGVIHRLDREVGGIMVYALNQRAAAGLSKAVQEHWFEKRYFAVLNGVPEQETAVLEDLLYHDKARNKTYVVNRQRNGVKPAKLEYSALETVDGKTLVNVLLHTGRTHQIRVQFASRKLPLTGDRKYGGPAGDMGLWSYRLAFKHPITGMPLNFTELPPEGEPWNLFHFDK